MSKNEKDYSDYMKHLSNLGNMYSFLSGFMYTAITILLTQLPERSSVMAQIALFFMAVMLNIFILYMGSFYQQVIYLCKNVPPYSGKRSFFNVLSDVSVILGLGGSTVLLFLLCDLIYLAIAQTVVWTLMSIVAYKSIFEPYYKRKEDSQKDSSIS